MHKTKSGFTIVELLIVIVVIGILAAITVIAYNGIQNRAVETAIQSDIANFRKKIELAKLDTDDGNYPAILTSAMGMAFSKANYRLTQNNLYYCVSPDRTQYAFAVLSKNGVSYLLLSSGSITQGTAANATVTCNAVGGVSSQYGYVWNGSTGTWQTWTN